MTEPTPTPPEPMTITFSPPIEAQRNGHPYRVLALIWKWGVSSPYGPPTYAVLADKWGNIDYTHATGIMLPADARPANDG